MNRRTLGTNGWNGQIEQTQSSSILEKSHQQLGRCLCYWQPSGTFGFALSGKTKGRKPNKQHKKALTYHAVVVRCFLCRAPLNRFFTYHFSLDFYVHNSYVTTVPNYNKPATTEYNALQYCSQPQHSEHVRYERQVLCFCVSLWERCYLSRYCKWWGVEWDENATMVIWKWLRGVFLLPWIL